VRRAQLFGGPHEFLRQLLGFPRQGLGMLGVARLQGAARLVHELVYLLDHVLLVRVELAAGELLQILIRRTQQPIGFVFSAGRLVAHNLNGGRRRSSVANDRLGRRTILLRARGT